MRKVYVDVNADHLSDGKIIPKYFVWEDGHHYEIDRVTDMQRCAALKVGGIGLRYTVYVRGKQTYMWMEDGGGRWFMESLR